VANEKTSDTASEQSPKKEPKKLVVTDGTETITPSESKKIVISDDSTPVKPAVGDTPAVTPEEELAELSAAIETIQEDPTLVPKEDAEPSEPSPEVEPSEPKEMTVGDAIAASTAETEDEPIPEEPVVEANSVAEESVDSDVEAPPVAVEEVAEPEQVNKEDFSDSKTAAAVDAIVATESDELLERQDAEKQQLTEVKKKPGLKAVFANWWKNPATKWGTIAGLFVVILLVAMLPASRYALLNAAGVRVKSSVTVMGGESQQPLKNAEVTIGGQSIKTDEKGLASFEKLKLGKTSVKITKRGYADIEQTRTLGWGSNPIGKVSMTVSGTQFSFMITDFLSDKGIALAEAESGDFNARADSDGKIVLPIDQGIDKDFEVTIKAPEYRDEKVTIKLSDQGEKKIKLVTSKKHVFVSKRSGKLDIYKIDADAKNEAVLLAATGNERDDLIVLPHPTSDYAAIVSTREGKRNKDGFLLSGLFVVNVVTGESKKITQSERIQLVDWVGDRIVYTAVTEGASAANAGRSKLLSFEIGQPGPKELAAANYFNDAVVFRGAVYYAPSSYAIPVANVKFYKVNPDGSGLATMFDKEVWNIFRNDYETLYLSVQQDWYELKAGSAAPTKLTVVPANQKSRVLKDSPDKKKALWVDTRDGKGVLLAYTIDTKKDDIIETKAGLAQPVAWLSSTTVVYRVSDGREVADYVKSTQGGSAVKLRDVTNTDTAYYFN